LLHGRQTTTQGLEGDSIPDIVTADSMAHQPTLIILHDILGLILNRQEEDGHVDEDNKGVGLDDVDKTGTR
jgi:hypothetical protein